jgi:hypothetical protein
MTLNTLQAMRELHSRVNDGIRVLLLWSETDGRVAVSVDDARTSEVFAVEVRSHDRALDVFHHPYAYAAWRGIDTRAMQAA